MKRGRILLLLIALAAIGLIGYASPGNAAHPTVDSLGNPISPVVLKDAAGAAVAAGSSTPYSPKQTCGICHNYESDVTTVTKDHGPGTTAYQVKVPGHGVSASYHVQQGRNIGWTSDNNNAQRTFYGIPKFTSSPGMYGKY